MSIAIMPELETLADLHLRYVEMPTLYDDYNHISIDLPGLVSDAQIHSSGELGAYRSLERIFNKGESPTKQVLQIIAFNEARIAEMLAVKQREIIVYYRAYIGVITLELEKIFIAEHFR